MKSGTISLIIISVLLLANAIVGAALVIHPWSTPSSVYFGVFELVLAVVGQCYLMLRSVRHG